MPAGRAQPPRGHPSLGSPTATSPVGTGAMTVTSGQAKSSSRSTVQDEAGDGSGEGRQWGGQAGGRAGRVWQDPLLVARAAVGPVALTALRLAATYLVLPPRCSAKACGCCSPSASGTRGAAQGRALSWGKRGTCLEGTKYEEISLLAADPRWWHPARSRDGDDGRSHG